MKAFPHTYDQIIDGHVATCTNYGMDLRDWFAGQVLPKLIGGAGMQEIAEASYKWADEMMKARNDNNE